MLDHGKTPHEIARTLRELCALTFEADPDTEVGKVKRSHVDPSAWFFHVYVMGDGPQGRHVLRSNIVVATPSVVSVSGPDEQAIGTVLKSPVL